MRWSRAEDFSVWVRVLSASVSSWGFKHFAGCSCGCAIGLPQSCLSRLSLHGREEPLTVAQSTTAERHIADVGIANAKDLSHCWRSWRMDPKALGVQQFLVAILRWSRTSHLCDAFIKRRVQALPIDMPVCNAAPEYALSRRPCQFAHAARGTTYASGGRPSAHGNGEASRRSVTLPTEREGHGWRMS